MRKRELSAERRELLAALNSAPGPLSPAGLARFMGKDREAVKRLLYKCGDDAQVITTDGGYTTAPAYKHITGVGEFGQNKPRFLAPSSPPGTENTDHTAIAGTEPGTDNGPLSDTGADPGTATEERSVSTAGAELGGGEIPANKPNSAPGMGVYCAEPPGGLPPGTYPGKRDELGRLTPDFSHGPLPPDPDFRG